MTRGIAEPRGCASGPTTRWPVHDDTHRPTGSFQRDADDDSCIAEIQRQRDHALRQADELLARVGGRAGPTYDSAEPERKPGASGAPAPEGRAAAAGQPITCRA